MKGGAALDSALGWVKQMSSDRNESVRLIWLEAFVAVAEAGTYAAAARELRTSPETLSRYIDQLELWLWRRLRENTGSIELTAIGLDFLQVAKEAIISLSVWRAERPPNTEGLTRPPAAKVWSEKEKLENQKSLAAFSEAAFKSVIDRKVEEELTRRGIR